MSDQKESPHRNAARAAWNLARRERLCKPPRWSNPPEIGWGPPGPPSPSMPWSKVGGPMVIVDGIWSFRCHFDVMSGIELSWTIHIYPLTPRFDTNITNCSSPKSSQVLGTGWSGSHASRSARPSAPRRVAQRSAPAARSSAAAVAVAAGSAVPSAAAATPGRWSRSRPSLWTRAPESSPSQPGHRWSIGDPVIISSISGVIHIIYIYIIIYHIIPIWGCRLLKSGRGLWPVGIQKWLSRSTCPGGTSAWTTIIPSRYQTPPILWSQMCLVPLVFDSRGKGLYKIYIYIYKLVCKWCKGYIGTLGIESQIDPLRDLDIV